MRLYANENFPRQTVEALRALGHDVLTTHEAGNSNKRICDPEVVRFAIGRQRAVVTHNWRDFVQIHALCAEHHGIVVVGVDLNYARQAARIDAEIRTRSDLAGQLIQVPRP